MKRTLALLAAGLAAAAEAEVRDEALAIGPEQVWIEVFAGAEIMWVGPNQHERTQVLSGPDIEIVGFATSPEDAALVGARAMVAVSPASHSCEDLSDPLGYSVVTLGDVLATDGPLTSCGPLEMSLVNGAILLEADPTGGEGAYSYWVPGRGFTDRVD
jgi:hypothetical protein